MFCIDPKPTFADTVKITVPGGTEPALLPLVFKHLTVEKFDEWEKGLVACSTLKAEAGELLKILDSWSVTLPDSTPVPLNEATLVDFLGKWHTAGQEIYLAYRRALRESRAKN